MTTDLDDVIRSLERIQECLDSDTTSKAIADIFTEQARLWNDQARLRDELHANVTALGNRIEGLHKAVRP